MKSVFLHVLGDALGSVAVIISALINMFAEFEGKEYIDPCVRFKKNFFSIWS